MKDQIIITMGREHGSGGHHIADMIARELGIKLYDKDSIESEIVSEGYSEELIRRMDEKPVNFFASRRIGRFSNSLEVNVAEKTFDMIRAKAASGESFLLIGRCGEQVLKDDPHRISLFIGGDPHAKLCRVMEKKGLSAEEAIEEIRTVDHQRKAYHNYYCEMKWGDARAYDLTVKSDVLGMEGTAEMLIRYIRAFQEKDNEINNKRKSSIWPWCSWQRHGIHAFCKLHFILLSGYFGCQCHCNGNYPDGSKSI